MGRTIQPIKDRLLRYRDVSPDGCWLWTASKNNAGYGHLGIRVDGRRRMIPVHRVAYEHFIGPIPEGLQIDHLCRVRACFNPEHLEPVSSRINTLRGTSSAAVNAAKTHCDRGHEFTPENTYLHPAGYRRCRTCQRRPDAAHRSKEAERSMTDLDAYHCRLCDGLLIDNGNAFETEVTRHQDGACFGAGATVRAVIA